MPWSWFLSATLKHNHNFTTFPGAPAYMVNQIEERFGITLPDTYKAFLAACDGFVQSDPTKHSDRFRMYGVIEFTQTYAVERSFYLSHNEEPPPVVSIGSTGQDRVGLDLVNGRVLDLQLGVPMEECPVIAPNLTEFLKAVVERDLLFWFRT